MPRQSEVRKGAAVHFFLAAPKQRAPDTGRLGIPRQRHERLGLADADELAGLGAVTDVVAVAVDEQVRGGAIDQLKALAGDHPEVLGGNAFAHDPAGDRNELAVQVPNAVRFNAGLDFGDLLFSPVCTDERLNIGGHCSPCWLVTEFKRR